MTTLTREEMLAKAQKMVEIAARMAEGQRWCPKCELLNVPSNDKRCFCDYESPMFTGGSND